MKKVLFIFIFTFVMLVSQISYSQDKDEKHVNQFDKQLSECIAFYYNYLNSTYPSYVLETGKIFNKFTKNNDNVGLLNLEILKRVINEEHSIINNLLDINTILYATKDSKNIEIVKKLIRLRIDSYYSSIITVSRDYLPIESVFMSRQGYYIISQIIDRYVKVEKDIIKTLMLNKKILSE